MTAAYGTGALATKFQISLTIKERPRPGKEANSGEDDKARRYQWSKSTEG